MMRKTGAYARILSYVLARYPDPVTFDQLRGHFSDLPWRTISAILGNMARSGWVDKHGSGGWVATTEAVWLRRCAGGSGGGDRLDPKADCTVAQAPSGLGGRNRV